MFLNFFITIFIIYTMQSNKFLIGIKGFTKSPLFLPFILYLAIDSAILYMSLDRAVHTHNLLQKSLTEKTYRIVNTGISGTLSTFARQVIETGGDIDKLKALILGLRTNWPTLSVMVINKSGKVIWESSKVKDLKIPQNFVSNDLFGYAFYTPDGEKFFIPLKVNVSGSKSIVMFIPLTPELLSHITVGIPALVGIYYKKQLISANESKFPQIKDRINAFFPKNSYKSVKFGEFDIIVVPKITLPVLSKGPLYFTVVLFILITVFIFIWAGFLSQMEALAHENIREKNFLYNFSYLSSTLLGIAPGNEKTSLENVLKTFCTRYGFVGACVLDSDLSIVTKYPESKDPSIFMNEIMHVDFKQEETMGASGVKHFVIVAPIPIEKGVKVGWIVFLSKIPFHREHPVYAAATLFGSILGLSISRLETIKMLRRIAFLDPVSYVFNMKYFVNIAKEELDLSHSAGYPLSMMVLDVDGFQEYVESYTEEDANSVIKAIGTILSRTLRGQDTIARVGNAQFAILLPRTTLEQAVVLAQKVKKRVENYPFPREKITVSIGVTSSSAFKKDTLKSLIQRAQQAVKTAKMEGGNKVVSINPDI